MEAVRVKADALLARFGMAQMRERSIYRLSRGEKQRLALAAVMMQSPGLLILDEPFSGLDQAMRQTVYEILMELQEGGVAVALISHERLYSERLAGRLIQVDSGVVQC